MQVDTNLAKISASHFWVLNPQNAQTITCETMIPICISQEELHRLQ